MTTQKKISSQPESIQTDSSSQADSSPWSSFFNRVAEQTQLAFKTYQETTSQMTFDDPLNVRPAFLEFSQKAFSNPEYLFEAQKELVETQWNLWQKSVLKFFGDKPEGEQAQPQNQDKRFKDPAWSENNIFNFIKDSYFITAEWLQNSVNKMDNIDPITKKKVDFYTRQFVDAIAPTNFFATNPEVLRETIKTNGMNIIKGMENLAKDFERGNGKLRIKTVDHDHFQIGKNIASTPGKVIFQTDLMQLIQYSPKTEKVDQIPLLIVPPWINKFYIFDLSDKKSFIKWALDHGKTVFIVSWVNPDDKLSHKTFDSYMQEGIIAAIEAIIKQTGEPQINVVGYCIGGTLLAATIAYLTEKKRDLIKSATFLTTLTDFTDAGDMSVFIDDKQLDRLSKRINKQGFLDAEALNRTYSILRANDMIWSFVINNYMLGREPFPFDLLYWNDDSTHMPAGMMNFFLRSMYKENLLAKPGGIKLDNVSIDLRDVKIPVYLLSAKEDHIAPWQTCYAGTQLFKGNTRFVLAASGHVAGMLNHPSLNKYNYWTNEKLPSNSMQWFKEAKQEQGSWWNDWLSWISKQGGKQIPALDPSKGKLKPIEDAPGSFVQVKMY
jgi:polyhydroxyalkanoate synthase subunit PhaC